MFGYKQVYEAYSGCLGITKIYETSIVCRHMNVPRKQMRQLFAIRFALLRSSVFQKTRKTTTTTTSTTKKQQKEWREEKEEKKGSSNNNNNSRTHNQRAPFKYQNEYICTCAYVPCVFIYISICTYSLGPVHHRSTVLAVSHSLVHSLVRLCRAWIQFFLLFSSVYTRPMFFVVWNFCCCCRSFFSHLPLFGISTIWSLSLFLCTPHMYDVSSAM